MSEATPSDVREVIDTSLSDLEIQDVLDRAVRDIDREYSSDAFGSTQHRRDFESGLTSLRICTGRDRRASSASSESSSVEFEASEVAALRSRVARLDPGEAFSTQAVRTDSTRGYGTAGYGGAE